MKAKLLLAIVFAIASVASGSANSAQDRSSRAEMISACSDANRLIPELIELAPYGAGVVNRTEAWFENLFGIIGDLFNYHRKGELSEVGKAVIGMDIQYPFLYFDLSTIMNVDYEIVEYIMPSKLEQPRSFIIMLERLKEIIVDHECRRFLG